MASVPPSVSVARSQRCRAGAVIYNHGFERVGTHAGGNSAVVTHVSRGNNMVEVQVSSRQPTSFSCSLTSLFVPKEVVVRWRRRNRSGLW